MDNKPLALKRLLSLLGLARKAGKLISGESACENAFKKHEVKLAVVCADASDNTKKKFSQKSYYYGCGYYELLSKNELSGAIGLKNRAMFVITDSGFGAKIETMIKEMMIKEI